MPYDDEGNYELPEWMEPFREDVESVAGGNTAEDLMTRLEREENLGFTNLVVAAMAFQVAAKIGLLSALRDRGALVVEPADDDRQPVTLALSPEEARGLMRLSGKGVARMSEVFADDEDDLAGAGFEAAQKLRRAAARAEAREAREPRD